MLYTVWPLPFWPTNRLIGRTVEHFLVDTAPGVPSGDGNTVHTVLHMGDSRGGTKGDRPSRWSTHFAIGAASSSSIRRMYYCACIALIFVIYSGYSNVERMMTHLS